MLGKTLLSCLLIILGGLAWSQTVPTHVEVFGGYTYTSSNFAWHGGGENGWNAGVGANAGRWFGLKADVSQYRSTYSDCCPHDHSTTTTFLFGPQISIPLPGESKVRPFGEFLLGGAHINYVFMGQSDTAFLHSTSLAWAFGGGLDFRLTKHLWLRGQADYLHNHFVTNDNQLQPSLPDSRVRVVTSLAYRF